MNEGGRKGKEYSSLVSYLSLCLSPSVFVVGENEYGSLNCTLWRMQISVALLPPQLGREGDLHWHQRGKITPMRLSDRKKLNKLGKRKLTRISQRKEEDKSRKGRVEWKRQEWEKKSDAKRGEMKRLSTMPGNWMQVSPIKFTVRRRNCLMHSSSPTLELSIHLNPL